MLDSPLGIFKSVARLLCATLDIAPALLLGM